MLVATHNTENGVCDLPVRGAVFFADDTNKSHQYAKFFIPVSVQHKSSWTFCVYLTVASAAPHPEYQLLHTIVDHILHSLVGRSQSPSEFYTHLETWSEKNSAMWILPLQQPYHSCCRNCTQRPCQHIANLKMFEALCIISLQHNTTTLAKMNKQTKHHTVRAVPPHNATPVLNSTTALNQPTVYRTMEPSLLEMASITQAQSLLNTL